jgi:hypothetical protein
MKSIYEGRADESGRLSKALSDEKGYSWCSILKKENGVLAQKLLQEKLNNITEQIQIGKIVQVSTNGSYFEGTVVHIFSKENKDFVYIDPSDESETYDDCFAQEKLKDYDELYTQKAGTTIDAGDNKFYKIVSASKRDVYKPLSTDLVRISNEWLKTEILKNKNQDLDCFLSSTVCKQIIRKLIAEGCTPICEAFMKVSYDMLVKLSEKAVDLIFHDNWPRLKHLITKLLTDLAEKCFEDTLSELQAKLGQEEVPYSQNDYLYETIKKKRNNDLKNRLLYVVGNMGDSCSSSAVQLTIKSFFEQNEKMSIDDHNALEMEIILAAYGKVASKRLIDDIPMISAAFFDHFFKTVRTALQDADKDLETIMKEPTHIANKRATLKKKIQDLTVAERAIDEFLLGY